jgi:hypothetical protein
MLFLKKQHVAANPAEGMGDLRRFIATRTRSDWLLTIPALILTGLVVFGFYKDSNIKAPYKRNIVYAESWPITRSDAEIKAQQAIDKVKNEKAKAEFEKAQNARAAEFKKYDDWLTNHGI